MNERRRQGRVSLAQEHGPLPLSVSQDSLHDCRAISAKSKKSYSSPSKVALACLSTLCLMSVPTAAVPISGQSQLEQETADLMLSQIGSETEVDTSSLQQGLYMEQEDLLLKKGKDEVKEEPKAAEEDTAVKVATESSIGKKKPSKLAQVSAEISPAKEPESAAVS